MKIVGNYFDHKQNGAYFLLTQVRILLTLAYFLLTLTRIMLTLAYFLLTLTKILLTLAYFLLTYARILLTLAYFLLTLTRIMVTLAYFLLTLARILLTLAYFPGYPISLLFVFFVNSIRFHLAINFLFVQPTCLAVTVYLHAVVLLFYKTKTIFKAIAQTGNCQLALF
jgi:hypothetical protein